MLHFGVTSRESIRAAPDEIVALGDVATEARQVGGVLARKRRLLPAVRGQQGTIRRSHFEKSLA